MIIKLSRRALAIAVAISAVLALPVAGAESAAEIIRTSGARPGLCIRLGATDGKLCAEFGEAGYVVHGLAPDAAAAEKARAHIRSEGIYGRVAVDAGSFEKLPYGDSLANLLIATGAKGFSVKEAARVIAPYGVACLKGVSAAEVKAQLAGAKDFEVSEAGGWVKITKKPPEGADEWRQWRHDEARSQTSGDLLARPPRHLKWIDVPRRGRNHKDHPRAVVSANGRNIILYDSAPPLYEVPSTWSLTCRDAYNGLVVWERPVSEFSGYCPSTLMAVGDRVYFVEKRNGPLLEIDAATGEKLREYKQNPTTVSYVDGNILLTGGGPVRLMDPKTGELKWTSQIVSILKNSHPIVADGRIYVQLSDGKYTCTAIVCLDLATGEEKWRQSHKTLERASLITCRAGVLVFSSHKADSLQVVDAQDGKFLWSHKYPSPGHGGSPSNIFVLGGMVWIRDNGNKTEPKRPKAWVGFDVKTGEKKKTIAVRLIQKCFRDAATEKYILSGVMNFIDWEKGETLKNRAVRAVCSFGFFVANGMVYTFPNDCKCFPFLRGTMGLSPETLEGTIEPDASERLVTGPAAGSAPGPEAGADDWPVYRAAPERHGVSKVEVPADVTELWATELGGELSEPTVAAGKAFAASIGEHRVHGLDATNGKLLWSFSTGARVDGPPTYYNGLVLFGCRDGWVYCLRAADGVLAWRFRAAPADRRILAYGQVESAWPVYGSVLVDDGKAYFAAGWHTELDGGMKVFCLDAASGKVVWEKEPSHFTYSDILLRGGKYLYMSQTRFDPATGENGPAFYSEVQGGVSKEVDWKKLPDQDQPHFSAGPSSTFEDSTYAHRTRWIFSPFLAAQMVVFDEKRFICIRAFPQIKGLQKYSRTRPGQGDYKVWMSPRKTEITPRKRGWTFHGWSEPEGWNTVVDIRPRALVLAGENVFIAGPEDAYPAKTAGLRCLSAADGKELSKLDIEAPPVFDGLIAAGGRLYMATKDGKLRCFGKK